MPFTDNTLLRQWQTLRLIPRFPRKISAGEICRRLEAEGFVVSKRTIERDLDKLTGIFPVGSDNRCKPFGWSWQKDAPAFDLPGLNQSEALALLMARAHLTPVLPAVTLEQLAPYFKQAEKNLACDDGSAPLCNWMDKVCFVHPTQSLLPPEINSETLAIVQEALLKEHQCEVTYRAREDNRLEEYPVHPLGLVQRGVVLYLICTIKNYSDIRVLALHRLQSAKLLSEKLNRPVDFDLKTHLASGAFGWKPNGTLLLEAFFAPDIGKHLHETPLSIDQKITHHLDGRLLVTGTVADSLQLRWWLLGFGDGVEVIAPKQLRQEIAHKVKMAASQYVAG